jgi:hypothetical protein
MARGRRRLFVEVSRCAVFAVDRQVAVIDFERHGAHGRVVEPSALFRRDLVQIAGCGFR